MPDGVCISLNWEKGSLGDMKVFKKLTENAYHNTWDFCLYNPTNKYAVFLITLAILTNKLVSLHASE